MIVWISSVFVDNPLYFSNSPPSMCFLLKDLSILLILLKNNTVYWFCCSSYFIDFSPEFDYFLLYTSFGCHFSSFCPLDLSGMLLLTAMRSLHFFLNVGTQCYELASQNCLPCAISLGMLHIHFHSVLDHLCVISLFMTEPVFHSVVSCLVPVSL